MKLLLFLLFLQSSFSFNFKDDSGLKYLGKQKLKFREPSDLSFDPQGNIWVASDDGFMVKIDTLGNILKRSAKFAYDLETICYHNDMIYTVNERGNMMHLFDTNFVEQNHFQLAISTALNRGVEALFFRPDKKCFVCVTEKKPILRELDSSMNTTNTIELPLEGDISSGMYYNNQVWLLSDESSCIYILNKNSYKLEKTLPLNILNPEGIASDAKGIIYIASDDMNTFYKYQYNP